jgi:pectinesterase
MRSFTLLFSLFVSIVLATTSPPSGALVVSSSSNAKYKTLQSAVTAAASGATIFIEPGTYKEQVYIPTGKNNLVIIGYSEAGTSYTGNKVTITQGKAQDSSGKPNNDNTATLRAWGDGLKVYNVNFVNSRGQGSQALALSAYGDKLGFYGCQFKGFQDTVMSQKGMHFIGKSLIVGATDFIFGQLGVLWVEKSVIQVVSAGVGYVTGKSTLPLFLPMHICWCWDHGADEDGSEWKRFINQPLLLRYQQL